MAVTTFGAARSTPSPSLLVEGFGVMRERLGVYLALAGVSAACAWAVFPRVDIYGALTEASNGHPAALFTQPPVSVVFVLSIAAVLFVLPSALRRAQPTFRMTLVRFGIALGTLVCVGAVVDAGYAFAVLPGIAAGVLLSQVLVGALLGAPERTSLAGMGAAIAGAFRRSFEMTRGHFATTLFVVAASLAMFVVPGSCALFALWILGVKMPVSLVVTTPLLLLVFVYSECVRYALIVRWYRRLAEEA
jgi:hypothetical protein